VFTLEYYYWYYNGRQGKEFCGNSRVSVFSCKYLVECSNWSISIAVFNQDYVQTRMLLLHTCFAELGEVVISESISYRSFIEI
jgi:hypothetical protein